MDEETRRSSYKVLVADDDDTLRGMLRTAIENAGYQVETVADGDQAARHRRLSRSRRYWTPDRSAGTIPCSGRFGDACPRASDEHGTKGTEMGVNNATKGYAPTGKDTGIVKSKGTARIPIEDGAPIDIRARKPAWLKVRSPGGENYRRLKSLMRGQRLHSVCEEAGCPNIGECWEAGTATFLILGDVCTRACKYCAIAHGMPTELDEDEPRRVAEACAELELNHVVITSVNRDELPDGGAGIFAETIRRTREARPGCTIEVLTPDFKGDEEAIATVSRARPDIYAHNLETVERLHPSARPGGRYWRSISFLGYAKRLDPGMLTKSGI
ncbi:MAG: lipoyl synthase, partial [Gemmatimonadota bacterium]